MSGEPAQNHGIQTRGAEVVYGLGARCLEGLNQKGEMDEKAAVVPARANFGRFGRFCRGWLFR